MVDHIVCLAAPLAAVLSLLGDSHGLFGRGVRLLLLFWLSIFLGVSVMLLLVLSIQMLA